MKVFRTNTPLHALLTLNDVTYVEAARALAERVLTEPVPAEPPASVVVVKDAASNEAVPVEKGSNVASLASSNDPARFDRAFRRVLVRQPSPQERVILLTGLKRSLDEFRADPRAAADLLKVGESKRNEKLDPIEHAGWTALCLAIMNLDEALNKE